MTSHPLTSDRYAVARMRGGVPQFFTGLFDQAAGDNGLPSPQLTGEPDQARACDDRNVAQLLVGLLNVVDGVRAGCPREAWIVMPLPEEWLP
ncbi:hypothetical protein [Rhodopseudomonas sp.]|uniref:hypothetical protein n=1 Tax=Rhodopseudomonas sp. TaxID=1078 RepID=UPI0039E5DCB4